TQLRALDADVLDRTLIIPDRERVSDPERFVQRYGHGRQQVAENGLDGERYGNTADTQAREQRLDLYAQVVESQQRDHGPDDQPRAEQDDVQGAGQYCVEARRPRS